MGRIREKLNSQSGVSFLLALLAFLVAAMVSVTIVAAAVTTVKRVNSDRESQQAQLTLISAAQLVRDEMEETRYIITTTTTETTTIGEDNREETYKSVSEDRSAEGTFAAEMKKAVEYVDANEHLDALYSADHAFEIEVDGFKMKPVDVSFVMKSGEGLKYNLVFTLSIKGTSETLFLKMNGGGPKPYGEDLITKTSTETSSTTVTVSKEAVFWEKGIISGIGDTNESKT